MSSSQSPWEVFARTDPEWFILTDLQSQRRSGESARDAFFRTGQEVVDEMLGVLRGELGSWRTALEIGPGLGRLSMAMAPHFEQLRVVDASSTMLTQLRENARVMGRKNIETHLPHEAWDSGPPLDFVYSRLVFQHIERADAIAEYLVRIGGALSELGCAMLQFDSRPQSLDYRVRNLLPDWSLPRAQRRGIRRIRRDAAWLDTLIDEAGMRVVEESGRGTAAHSYLLRRAPAV